MTSINFKDFGFARLGFKPMGSALEPVIFGFPDLPEQEVGMLFIRLVQQEANGNHTYMGALCFTARIAVSNQNRAWFNFLPRKVSLLEGRELRLDAPSCLFVVCCCFTS